MKRLLVIIFSLSTLMGKTQILDDSVRAFNCYHSGAIFLDIFPASQIDYWYFHDDSLGWIDALTIQEVQFSNNLDTLTITDSSYCGSYKVVVSGDTSFFYIGHPLGSRGNQDNVKCFGDSSGMLKRVAHSGSSPYFYEWYKDGNPYSSGYNDTLFDNLTVGSYEIFITDSVGCTVSSDLNNITSPPLLRMDTLHMSDVNCRGVNSGTISASFSGGKQYIVNERYDYYLIHLSLNDTVCWLNRDSVSLNISSVLNPYQVTFDSLFATEYIISIVDSFGCTLNDTFELTQPEPYQVFASTIFPLLCESDSGYLMIDSILGGDSISFGFNYNLAQGPYGDSLYVPSGWYEIFIEDLNFGCIDTVPVRCYAQYEISVFETITDVSCFGEASGSIIIDSIIGGNTPYDIQWGSVNNSLLSAGLYSVNIVDSIGCVHEEEYEIFQPDQIIHNAEVYSSSCFGMINGSISIDVSGGLGELSYYWLNGIGVSDSLYGLNDGVYTLIISDTIFCVDTFNFYLETPELLEVNLVGDSILPCNGVLTLINVMISGGTAPYSINWNDGDTSEQRVLGAGYYEVEVIDVNGCSSTENIIITEPTPLEITISYTDISCVDGATATVSSIGGVPPISYLWNTGDTVFSIDSLWELTYWVIATDSCGLSASDTIYLQYYELNTQIEYDSSEHTAELEIQSTTSLGPFEYEWLNIFGDSIGTGNISPVLCQGTYFVNTIDLSNDCSIIDTILVQFDLPLGIVDITTTSVYSEINLWGFPPYTYLWSNGEVLEHADICPGDHWVEVTDVNGCLVREDFTIEDILIELDPATAIIECNLENLDVDLEAIATGGVEPYSYEWSNGSKESIMNLEMNPGSYSISVTDANGCVVDTTFLIATMTSECIPNVFTPNGDNINDTWSLEDTFLYEDTRVRIYGRFGTLLFQSIGYHERWDGKNEKGNDVPEGVYFYFIDIGHGFDQIQGTVTILR